MRIKRIFSNNRSELLAYLAGLASKGVTKVASIHDLSEILNLSSATVREQLEVARIMGFIDIKPKKGITINPFSVRPAIRQSTGYAIAVDANLFYDFLDFRNHIETAYWKQAVALLTENDHQKMKQLVESAERKLDTHPIQIPQLEHRELHLMIYSQLDNPFVTGNLEAYWELYEAVGFDLYADYAYLKNVWQYHRKIVESIMTKEYEIGYRLLIEHIGLLQKRPHNNFTQLFE
jgi:DNA-binding FadR family transcriptional regulator